MAIAILQYFDIPNSFIKEKLDYFSCSEGRGNIIKRNNILIYNYSYNCSLTALEKNIESFKKNTYDNKIIILGKISEIKNVKEVYLDIFKKCLNITKNVLCLRDPNVNLEIKNILFFDEIGQILNYYLKLKKINTAILIQGSNKSNLTKIIDLL